MKFLQMTHQQIPISGEIRFDNMTLILSFPVKKDNTRCPYLLELSLVSPNDSLKFC